MPAADTHHALSRILRAWKVKIRRALEPGSQFDFWEVIGCNRKELQGYIEEQMQGRWKRDGHKRMEWAGYGTFWTMHLTEQRKVVTLDDLHAKFYFKNFVPRWIRPQAAPVIRKAVAK